VSKEEGRKECVDDVNLTTPTRRKGKTNIKNDLPSKNQQHTDADQDEGFALTIGLVLRIQEGGLLFLGPECSSWTWINRGTSGRKKDNNFLGRPEPSDKVNVITVMKIQNRSQNEGPNGGRIIRLGTRTPEVSIICEPLEKSFRARHILQNSKRLKQEKRKQNNTIHTGTCPKLSKTCPADFPESSITCKA